MARTQCGLTSSPRTAAEGPSSVASRPRKRLSMLLGLAGLLATTACALTEQPERAYEAAKPSSLPQRTVTNFSEALNCMDRMFLQFGVSDLVITSAGLPDQTGQIRAGTKDMLISAVARMSATSRAFKFVDYDPMQIDVHELQNLVGFTDDFVVPNYYIRGAVTQLDQGVLSDSVGGGLALSDIDIGVGKDLVASVISVDMNLGDLLSRQILPGMTSSNSLVVARRGIGGDLGATIESTGVFFNLDMNRSEGVGQSIRTLIELTTIEVLGRLAEVPYWRCLGLDHTDPSIVAEARGWFDGMSTRERVSFVQDKLRALGSYNGPISGAMDGNLQEAIAQYQANQGLKADGRINFALYQRLIGDDLGSARPQAAPSPAFERASLTTSAPPRSAPIINLELLGQSTIRAGDKVTSRFLLGDDAFVYCYYQSADGAVARVFPNRFRPNALVLESSPTYLPAPEDGFDIIPDNPGSLEQIACIAANTEVGLRLPDAYQIADLTPLPVRSIDDVIASYRSLDPGGVTVERLEIVIVN